MILEDQLLAGKDSLEKLTRIMNVKDLELQRTKAALQESRQEASKLSKKLLIIKNFCKCEAPSKANEPVNTDDDEGYDTEETDE